MKTLYYSYIGYKFKKYFLIFESYILEHVIKLVIKLGDFFRLKRERRNEVTQHAKEELSAVLQTLLSIFLMAIFAHVTFLTQSVFPWYSILGFGLGLAIVVYLWLGRKSKVFVSFLLLFTFVYSIAYNFAAIFPLH